MVKDEGRVVSQYLEAIVIGGAGALASVVAILKAKVAVLAVLLAIKDTNRLCVWRGPERSDEVGCGRLTANNSDAIEKGNGKRQ